MSHYTTFSEAGRLVDAGRCAPMKTPRSSSSLKITCSIRCATNPTAYLTQTTFERSKLLDYLSRAIDVHLIPDGTDAPASWKHYGIYTQNQIIDIVAPSEATVRTSF